MIQKIASSLVLLAITLQLASCTSMQPSINLPSFKIDNTTYRSQNKGERIKFIVLHYTADTNASSIKTLTEGNVSVHYLILQGNDNKIYNLVPLNERAWHAGEGKFADRTLLNDTSVGIEIVNSGVKPDYREVLKEGKYDYLPNDYYIDYQALQIRKVGQLVKALTDKYDIKPTHIIGHSDMAPSRKIDPGAKFPWEHLYKEYGVGAWYDNFDKQLFINENGLASASIADIKQLFRDYGYAINDSDEWDRESQNVIYAFQLHFRPQKLTGKMDLETYAILQALNKKYVEKNK